MIYVSTSCIKHKKIKDSIEELVSWGFGNLELSGGTDYYDALEADLLSLKKKLALTYICHNYFPPPPKHFVLNLASLDDGIYEKTLEHLLKSIALSRKLESKKFGFHAGFFVDIGPEQIGCKFSEVRIAEREKAMRRFCDGFRLLQSHAGDMELYLENNVLSSDNFAVFGGRNVFMLTTYSDYEELRRNIDFKLLLDVAHLKVSSRTLNLDFMGELEGMLAYSDYVHLSDNDGFRDLNQRLEKGSDFLNVLRSQKTFSRDYTLEVYGSKEALEESYERLQGVLM